MKTTAWLTRYVNLASVEPETLLSKSPELYAIQAPRQAVLSLVFVLLGMPEFEKPRGILLENQRTHLVANVDRCKIL